MPLSQCWSSSHLALPSFDWFFEKQNKFQKLNNDGIIGMKQQVKWEVNRLRYDRPYNELKTSRFHTFLQMLI